MLVYCARCAEKQTASNKACFRCGFVIGERQKFDPFGRSQIHSLEQSESEDKDILRYDFDEDVSFPVRVYFALTNPWRKRWRRGFLWRLTLVFLMLLVIGLFGYCVYFLWSTFTDEEINNLCGYLLWSVMTDEEIGNLIRVAYRC